MPAYVIVDVHVKDAERYQEYRTMVPASLEKYGGKFLVRAGKFEKLEGDRQFERVVVLEFPSVEAARRWYDSPEYREARALRLRTADSHLIIVEGV
ncbi:MAG TPA: DUF1330 domain-containing protein [Candidatus Limnocylindria bacterium]|nr:DUF1330 domain-containing protein [Candidatus Limnocylindria bacterium]